MKTFPIIPESPPRSGLFATKPREPMPPTVDHDPGDEQPRIRIQRYSTFFGEPRTCGVCGSINDVVDSLWRAHDKDHCKACRSKLDTPIVLRQFTREELFGASATTAHEPGDRRRG